MKSKKKLLNKKAYNLNQIIMKVESFKIIDQKKKQPFKIINNITEVINNKNNIIEPNKYDNPKDNNISNYKLINKKDTNFNKVNNDLLKMMKRIKNQIQVEIYSRIIIISQLKEKI